MRKMQANNVVSQEKSSESAKGSQSPQRTTYFTNDVMLLGMGRVGGLCL